MSLSATQCGEAFSRGKISLGCATFDELRDRSVGARVMERRRMITRLALEHVGRGFVWI